MKKIYIDHDCKCHVDDDGTMFTIETDFFDGKCDAYIEGFRLVPEDRIFVREDGKVFRGGNMITAWKPYNELLAAQTQYEADQEALAAAYQDGVNSV